MMIWLAVFLGGGLGSLARYGLARWFLPQQGQFPIATLLANLASCVVLALVVRYFSDKPDAYPLWRLFLIVGFCGGFSTFSTFSYETVLLMRSGHMAWAILNILISTGACVGILYWLARIRVL